MPTDEVLAAFSALEALCERCGGEGGYEVVGTNDWARCGTCGGGGYVPTPLGERVLALMRHNFRPMLEGSRGE